MLTTQIRNITRKTLTFLRLQFFLTLIALPILLSWGLPVSYMTVVGNFIFSPCLTAFLSLSALLFFTELCNIPNGWVVYALELCSWAWAWCIEFGSSSFLISFIQPHYLVLLAIPAVALIIVQLKKITLFQQVAALTVLMLAISLYLSFLCPPTSYYTTLPCNKGKVFLFHHNNQTVLVDPGFIARSASAPSWMEHTVVKELNKQVGNAGIQHLILLQPSIRVFEAVTKLCQLTHVEKIYFPYWQGKLEKKQWRTFFDMKRTIEKTNGKLVRLKKSLTLYLDPTTYIHIMLQQKTIKTSTINYPAFKVRAVIGPRTMATQSIKACAK